jgi:hypothetical protein
LVTEPRLLLIFNLVTLANEAFLMLFPHVFEELIVAKHTLTTELAQRMGTTFDFVSICGWAVASL